MEIIIATKNQGKVKDFKTLFHSSNVLSLLDFDGIPDIDETGSTFKENAIIKAEAISKRFGKIVIADDSGLSIDALGGNPGVYSARYAGEQKDDAANIKKVLEEMKHIDWEERTARFHCALAVAFPAEESIVVEGTCEGKIAMEPVGDNGFGYDPIFFVENKNKTMAQLSVSEKNEISHRRNALRQLQLQGRLREYF